MTGLHRTSDHVVTALSDTFRSKLNHLRLGVESEVQPLRSQLMARLAAVERVVGEVSVEVGVS